MNPDPEHNVCAAAEEKYETIAEPSHSFGKGLKLVTMKLCGVHWKARHQGTNYTDDLESAPVRSALAVVRARVAAPGAGRAMAQPTAAMSLEEVETAVTAEGLTLVRSSANKSGFTWVTPNSRTRWKAQLTCGGSGGKPSWKDAYLGSFGSAAEAALAVARELGPQGSAAAAAAAGAAPSMSLGEVEAAVAAEGLMLARSSRNDSGFKGVLIKENRWEARQTSRRGPGSYLGSFGSAAEAALAVARKLGPQGSAEAALAYARTLGPQGTAAAAVEAGSLSYTCADAAELDGDDDTWVGCDTCQKWRRLPARPHPPYATSRCPCPHRTGNVPPLPTYSTDYSLHLTTLHTCLLASLLSM